MTSSDRLRAAADELLDGYGDRHAVRPWPEEDLCVCGLDWDAAHRKDLAIADLLWVIADLHQAFNEVENDENLMRIVSQAARVTGYGDDLANAVLGDK